MRARFAYHPTERWDDPEGWAGERIFFLGVDDRWRVLDMGDLRLPVDSWPGPDTYGPGSLSRDGRIWAGKARGGVVLLDLSRAAVRYVRLPEGRSRVAYVDWVPGQKVVSAYAAPGSTKFSTFHVDNKGRVAPAAYPGSRTRFDVDGTPVEVIGTDRRRLKLTRWGDDGISSKTFALGVEIPRSIRSPTFGVFGAAEVALYAHGGDWPSAATAQVWVLDKNTGAMNARLRVPATSQIVDWTDDGWLRLLVANRRVVEWEPRTGQIRQVLDMPGPYPVLGEWAAATIAFPSQ